MEIMTVNELAKYLKMHRITITLHANEGKIPGWRIGKQWRFDREVIDKMFQKGGKDEMV